MPRFSLEDVERAQPENPAKMRATKDADIQRHKQEDGAEDLGDLDPSAFTVRSPYPPVRELRQKLHMTQERFAAEFGLSVWTVRDWEQGKAEPEGPARTLLRVIEADPEAVRRALGTAA